MTTLSPWSRYWARFGWPLLAAVRRGCAGRGIGRGRLRPGNERADEGPDEVDAALGVETAGVVRRGRYATDVPVMAAAATIVSLPTIIIYVIFQRHFIRGMIAGALKG